MAALAYSQVEILNSPGIRVKKNVGAFANRSLRSWMIFLTLALTDIVAIASAWMIAILVWHALVPQLDVAMYLTVWPLLGVFTACYAAAGLYGAELNGVLELKRSALAGCLAFAVLAIALFLSRQAETFSRGVFVLGWIQTIVYVPLARNYVRSAAARRDWWGHAAVVIGSGELAHHVVQMLRKNPGFGLKPIAVLDDRPDVGHVGGIPVTGGIEMARVLGREGVRYVIVAQQNLSRPELLGLFSRLSEVFVHTLLVPDMIGLSSLWVSTADLGGVPGLRIKQQLLLPSSRSVKFMLDRVLSVLLGVAVLPVIAAACAAIKLTSPGPIFYSQRRLGRRGQNIRVWKFRTMVQNAEQVLEQYLAQDIAMREEWQREQKLRNDPRITPIGRLLRRTSLDELPQLWNVIKGEMSLVGPRPIVDAEREKYGGQFALYQRVTPGLTGLWQVSGRNDVTYRERVMLDVYYVRNWSVWLDLHILARTVGVVLFRKGAY